jgi:hypothetical protein
MGRPDAYQSYAMRGTSDKLLNVCFGVRDSTSFADETRTSPFCLPQKSVLFSDIFATVGSFSSRQLQQLGEKATRRTIHDCKVGRGHGSLGRFTPSKAGVVASFQFFDPTGLTRHLCEETKL